jgi:hypothetical protein
MNRIPICVKLLRYVEVADGKALAPVLPRDLREAAKLIESLYTALKELRGNIGCASLVRNPVGIRLREQADKALSQAHTEVLLDEGK